MKKIIAITIAGAIGLAGLALTNFNQTSYEVLKVANWAEYIFEGDEEQKPLVTQFEEWYQSETGKKIHVEYCVADDNEILYNMIKMGDHFDLICPSEYMMMKLVAKDELQKLPASFFDTSIETNYYAKNVSPFIKKTFETNFIEGAPWKDYVAGYMWGTTGFVYNPNPQQAPSTIQEDVKTWNIFTNPTYKGKITAKNNIRDSYFCGLAMHYNDDLVTWKQEYENGALNYSDYQKLLSERMNDTKPETMNLVKKKLMQMTSNLYGFETDEGKNEMISGNITVNYQWSGDAVYIMDTAEESGLFLEYCIPDTVSNLWFDGWTLTKACKNIDAALMFINFLSIPENVKLNMDYIGYTSCIGGSEVYKNVVLPWYEAEEGVQTVPYDLNYYFNPNYIKGDVSTIDESYIFDAPIDQLKRQLFAQYPDENTLDRCVAMSYFNDDENMRANSMWSDITFF